MEGEETKISQIKVEETPINCPVCPPCPVPQKTKPGKAFLKVLFLFILALILAAVVLVGSGIKIIRKESLLDLWLARNQAPTPTVIIEPTPTPDPTADWKTYTNTKYGFSFKYPNEVINIGSTTSSDSINLKKDDSNFAVISIYQNMSVNDYLKKYESGDPLAPTTNVSTTEIVFNNIEATKVNIGGVDVMYFVLFVKNNQLFKIELDVTAIMSDPDNTNRSLFDQILSTFKFVSLTPTSSPSAQTKGGLTQGTPVKIKSISLTTATGPLVIKGTVDFGWMFEGVMPVLLLDSSRNEIASGSATETTPGSWQSGKAVDFSVSLAFTTKDTSGFLVFKNDNPSGFPENQKTFELPVKFAQR